MTELSITISVLCAAVFIIGLIAYKERKPNTSLSPRLFPAIPAMFVSGIVALYALVHLLNLYGIQTGR
jgi:hypothetical protein